MISTNIYDESTTFYPCVVYTVPDIDGFVWKCGNAGGVEGNEGHIINEFARNGHNIAVHNKCYVEVLTNTVTGERSAGWKQL